MDNFPKPNYWQDIEYVRQQARKQSIYMAIAWLLIACGFALLGWFMFAANHA